MPFAICHLHYNGIIRAVLSLPILFHFNQHFNQYAEIASKVCYRGLLKVLRSHSSTKFNIHISGTLIGALKWLDAEPLEMICDGIKDGQFEILGSTYAQNIPYSSDDWDNARQIELHREVIKDTFGVEPTTFWNPERCWRQSLIPLIKDAGYERTLIEDHILRGGGVTVQNVITTKLGTQSLIVIPDDETLKHKFNFAAWFGRETQLLNYLQKDEACLAYAEDAEAMGLWGWERGVDPTHTWKNLDHLLTTLESQSGIKLIHFADAPAPQLSVDSIPDGSAAWMNASLKRDDAPYHEDGYADWFDFNKRSPKLTHFKQTYSIIRSRLQEVKAATHGAQQLKRAALHAFLANQYEYGCIGVGGLNYIGWENARTAVPISLAAKFADEPKEFVVIEDCNGDGSDEVLISDGKQLLIVTAYGGRLLYWFDLGSGRQFIGNQLPVLMTDYHGDGSYPKVAPTPKRWLPDSSSTELMDVPLPTPYGKFFPEWIWDGEPTPFKLPLRSMETNETTMPLIAQTRAFADHVLLNSDENESRPEEWLDCRLEKNGVTFIRYLSDELTLEKSFRISRNNAVASYTLRNHDTQPRSFRLRVTHELCPDYAEVIRGGRDALRFIEGRMPGALNTRTQTALVVTATRMWQSVERRVDFCALTIGLIYDVTLAPRSEQRFDMRLERATLS